MAETRDASTPRPKPAVNADGVDLTQIRALLAMTPTQRLHALVATVRNLERLRRNVRRV
jgi:hypothetical protein